MKSGDTDYWIQLLNKLNAADDIDSISKEVLEELCQRLMFGVGFIYQADYKNNYHLTKAYEAYAHKLPEVIEGGSFLSPEQVQEALDRKLIYYRCNTRKGAIEKKLASIFRAESMVLIPARGEENDIIALVGLVDRRGEVRHLEEDIAFTGAILTTLSTYIKMQMYEKRIRSAQKALESVLNNMGVDVYVNDFDTHEILYLNESMARPYGSIDQMIGRYCWEALYEGKAGECDFCPKPKLLDAEGNPTKIYGWDYRRPFDGAWFRVLSAAFPWVDGRMAQVISSIDITENKRNEEIIQRTADYDMLTALPNRAKLSKDMDQKLSWFEENGKEGYVIFFDLDGFKQVNDTKGHHIGDELLTKVGVFLQSSPLTHDRSYRYGGDEFVVLWDPSCPGTLDDVLTYLRKGFSRKWKLDSCEVRCGASYGISHYPSDGELSSNLLRNADLAMYTSKNVGTGSVHFYNKGALRPSDKYQPGEKVTR